MLKKIDVEHALLHKRRKDQNADLMLREVYELLHKTAESDERITKNLAAARCQIEHEFDFDLLETQRIFHLDQIKEICIDYRLRFLDTKYFKGKIPAEGISKIKQLEELHDIELKGFKILAPSKLFKLDNLDDPLLFAPIGNNYFYLIHKWGNDLHPLRKLFMWPFKSVVNLATLLIGISLLLTLFIPNGLFSKTVSGAEFWVVFFFVFKSVVAVVIFYGFALGKNFNPAIWNSKYYNV